jgi:putative transposase
VALARERRRFGYRRLLIFLRREGFVVNHKRLFRPYRKERLMVRKRGRPQASFGHAHTDAGTVPAEQSVGAGLRLRSAGQRRRFRILTIYDVCTRPCLAAIAYSSLPGKRAARELDRLIAARGKPRAVGSYNGTELTSNAILAWTGQTGVDWHSSPWAGPCRTPSSRASMAAYATSS